MANKDGTDILMQLSNDSGPLDAECQSQVDPSDTFMAGFSAGTFFEVKSFGFGMKIDDKDQNKETVGTGSSPTGAGFGRTALGGKDSIKGKKDAGGPFSEWKTANATQLAKLKYPVRMDDFDITRTYDRASPVLFKYCCDSGSFKTATLVKRKDIGARTLQGFLRLEFQDVLITHVGWDNDEVVKEKFKFVFRQLTVRYCTTVFKANSSVGTMKEQPQVVWKYDTTVVGSKQAQ